MGIKSFVEKLKDAYSKEDVFWENEIKANWFVAKVLINLAFFIILNTVLYYLGIVEFQDKALLLVNYTVTPIILIAALLCSIYKGERHWLKYLMCITLIGAVGAMNSVENPHTALLMAFPIVLSCRYYDKKMTRRIAVVTILDFIATEMIYILKGTLDMNHLSVAEGDFHVGPEGLQYVLSHMDYDKKEYIRLAVADSMFPKLVFLVVITIACVELSGAVMKMVLDQESITKKNTRIEMELTTAGTIQSNMIPSIFPMFPEREEFDVYASMTPAKAVGGDFYDMFLVDEDHLALVMADVSDKGIPAALFMMVTKILINDLTMQGLSPAEVLYEVNNRLCAHNEADMFVTIWLGIYDIKHGKLVASNAGHEYPILKRGNGKYELIKDKHGLVVAGMEDSEYENYEFELHKGDALFVYTDGVAEAHDAEGAMFGTDRTLEVLNSNLKREPEAVIHDMTKAIDEFVGDTDQFDDITMLSFLVKKDGDGQ